MVIVIEKKIVLENILARFVSNSDLKPMKIPSTSRSLRAHGFTSNARKNDTETRLCKFGFCKFCLHSNKHEFHYNLQQDDTNRTSDSVAVDHEFLIVRVEYRNLKHLICVCVCVSCTIRVNTPILLPFLM